MHSATKNYQYNSHVRENDTSENIRKKYASPKIFLNNNYWICPCTGLGQTYKNPWCPIAWASTFHTVASNICRYSEMNLLHVTVTDVHKFEGFLDFWKIYLRVLLVYEVRSFQQRCKPMRTKSKSRSLAVACHDGTSALAGLLVNATPRPFYPKETAPVPTVQGQVRPQGRSGGLRIKCPGPTEVKRLGPTGVPPAGSDWLYRLCHPGP
jgi:hypothetical protein